MIIGIFTQWKLEYLNKAEYDFKEHLDKNPCFPFDEKTPGIFVLHANSGRLTAGMILIATSLALIVFFIWVGQSMSWLFEWLLTPIIIGIYSICLLLRGSEARTYVIDAKEHMYEFYTGPDLVYRGHVHNIYIRLIAVRSGGSENYYAVTLNGYMVDEQNLTGYVTRKERLFKLAKKLATKLDINFFDVSDKSREHIIRHRCPYATPELTLFV